MPSLQIKLPAGYLSNQPPKGVEHLSVEWRIMEGGQIELKPWDPPKQIKES